LLNKITVVVVVALCGLVSACSDPTGKLIYHPPVLPIEISVATDGTLAIQAGAEFVTPIGTFSIAAEVETPSDDTTLLVIAHTRPGGGLVQERFAIASTERLGVCFNGSAYGEFGDRRILLNAFGGGSTITIVPPGTRCPARKAVQPPQTGTSAGYQIGRVTVGGTALTVLIADTPAKGERGLSDVSSAQLRNDGIDGMLYLLPTPVSFNPNTGEGSFTFPGYRFATDVHFFDAAGRYWGGGPVRTCAADRHDCVLYFASFANQVPVPYQYVLELLRGRLRPVAPGTPLRALS
jgi:hypothetical protein